MAKHNELSQVQINEICLVYDECKNQIETAKKTKHSITTVSKYLIANGRGCGQGGNQETQRKITDKQILQGIVDGLTRQEIANKYGVHIANLDRRIGKLGVHAKRATRQYHRGHRVVIGNTWHWTPGADKMVKEKQGGCFELVEFQKDRLRIRCVKCGFVIERARSTVRQKKCLCDNCEKQRKKDMELEKARIKLMRSFYTISELKKPKVCAACGKEFHSQVPNKKYCSDGCKKKSKKSGCYRQRARKYGSQYESGITLIKVFNRDNGVCKICGKPCDWNDHSWGNSFGALYPTIDHITALANGGGHTWNNVQLAHAICNSYKRNLITA